MKKIVFSFLLIAFAILPFACTKQSDTPNPEKQAQRAIRNNKSAPAIPIGFSAIQVIPELVSPTGILEETFTQDFTYTHANVTSTGQLYFAMDVEGDIISLAIDNGTLSNTGLTPAHFEAEMAKKGPIEDLMAALKWCRENETAGKNRRRCRANAWLAFTIAALLD